jgi:hypothetical protein
MSPRTDLVPRRYQVLAQGQKTLPGSIYVASFIYSDGFIWSVFELQ